MILLSGWIDYARAPVSKVYEGRILVWDARISVDVGTRERSMRIWACFNLFTLDLGCVQ
jgi:predicted sulfurtransferase